MRSSFKYLLFLLPAILSGQSPEGNDRGLVFRSASSLEQQEGFFLAPLDLWSSFNLLYPHGEQDGSAWQGRGFNGGLRAGGGFENSWLRLKVVPEVWAASNWDFSVLPSSTNAFGDYWWGLDRPQRFGNAPLVVPDAGDSEIRLTQWNWTLGFGNEQISVGPGRKNNILLGLQAPGFPHVDLGTRNWFRTGWGDFQARWLWGQLRESSWFDKVSGNDFKFFHGGSLGYRLPGQPGISFGFNRYFLSPWNTLDPVKGFQWFLDEFFKDSRSWLAKPQGQEDDVDQAVSLTFQWFLPEAGMELWLEWAKNDHPLNFYDFWTDPFISQGFVWGISKSWALASAGPFNKLVLWTEWHDTAVETGVLVRTTASWYRHNRASGGYTHAGQSLGANAGPGSQGQFIEARLEGKDVELSVGLQRLVIDFDYLYKVVKPADVTWFAWRSQVETSLPLVLKYTFPLGRLSWELRPIYHQNFNWDQDANPFNVHMRVNMTFFEGAENEQRQ